MCSSWSTGETDSCAVSLAGLALLILRFVVVGVPRSESRSTFRTNGQKNRQPLRRKLRHNHAPAAGRHHPRSSGGPAACNLASAQRETSSERYSGPSQLLHRNTATLDSKAMATRLLHSPSRGLAAPATASRIACARLPVAALSGGNAPLRQLAQSSQTQQSTAAAVHAQRLQPPGVSHSGSLQHICTKPGKWGPPWRLFGRLERVTPRPGEDRAESRRCIAADCEGPQR